MEALFFLLMGQSLLALIQNDTAVIATTFLQKDLLEIFF